MLIMSELHKLKAMMKNTCISDSVELTACRTIKHMEDALRDMDMEDTDLEYDDMKQAITK